MAVTSYYSGNGILLGEKSTGNNRVDYLSDALGSVTATVNSSATIVNTYRYKPYGTQLAKTGVGIDPAFTWVGQWGYRQTAKKFSDVYVRARHYSSSLVIWTSRDLFLKQYPYNYVMGNPIGYTDPSGLLPKLDMSCSTMPASDKTVIGNIIKEMCGSLGNPSGPLSRAIVECLKKHGLLESPSVFRCLTEWCNSTNDIRCGNEENCSTRVERKCTRKNPCPPPDNIPVTVMMAKNCAYSKCNTRNKNYDPMAKITFCSWWWTDFPTVCPLDLRGSFCGSGTGIVPGSPGITLVHELIHNCSKCDGGDEHTPKYNDAAICILKSMGLIT